MKKATFFAAAMMMGLAVSATSLNAMAAGNVQTIVINASQCQDVFNEYLENCNWDNINIIKNPCLPGNIEEILGNLCFPEVEKPEKPDTELPETEQPETPDVELPETEEPETPDVELPEVEKPETPGNPDTNVPDTENPDMEILDEEDSEQSVHAYVLRIVELVNEEREKAGLNTLTLKEDITAAAQVRAEESEILFSHTRPDGSSFSTALNEAGVSYRGAGENIAWGQKSPEEVMKGWMNSAGHRANILNEKYTSIGVGYYQNSAGVNYWSQLFTY